MFKCKFESFENDSRINVAELLKFISTFDGISKMQIDENFRMGRETIFNRIANAKIDTQKLKIRKGNHSIYQWLQICSMVARRFGQTVSISRMSGDAFDGFFGS